VSHMGISPLWTQYRMNMIGIHTADFNSFND
jgi:hypothetical protein